MSAERSSLAILQIHKNNDVNIDNVVLEFARLNPKKRLRGKRLSEEEMSCPLLVNAGKTLLPSGNCPKG